MQAVANHLRFRRELNFVRKLLEVAAAATAEVRARRLDSHRRGRDDLFNGSKQDVALLSLDSHAHAISGRSKRNKHSLPNSMRQPQATGNYSFHFDLKSHK